MGDFYFSGGEVLKSFYRFILTFVFLFISNLIVNALLKHNLNILTAFSVAFGCAFGLFLVEIYAIKKLFKDDKDECITHCAMTNKTKNGVRKS